jgi:hypothetical protein
MVQLLLNPYKSVITTTQTEQLNICLHSNHNNPYTEIPYCFWVMKSYLPTKRFLRLTAGGYTFVIMARDTDRMRLLYPHLIKLDDKKYYHNLRFLEMIM